MRRRRLPLAACTAVLLVLAASACGGGGGGSKGGAGKPVAFHEVRALFATKCAGCHPGVVPSLDLTAQHSYASIVGVRAIEDPALVRVVAGDPDRSFLYLKVAGWPGSPNHPAIGGRMPFGEPPLPEGQVDLLRRWILQGAKGADGKTHSAAEVATAGSVDALGKADVPQATSGDGRIAGLVTDAHHRPIANAVVAMLLVRKDLPGGEEHYLAGVTDASGHYEIRGAPEGRVEIKAYSPGTVYVSRVLETEAGKTTNGDVGLPREALSTTTTEAPGVRRTGSSLELSMRVGGTSIDQNYTLAVNPASGRVFELGPPPGGGERPGVWSRKVPAQGLTGRWIFISISHLCTIAPFLTVSAPS